VEHIPVLRDEIVEYVAPSGTMTIVDGTFGVGGHAAALAGMLSGGIYVAIDRDPSAERFVRSFAEAHPQVHVRYEPGAYAAVLPALAREGVSADAVILDVGVSSMQLDQVERGFSYVADATLDMRMDPTTGQSAAEFLATESEQKIAGVLREFGEERYARGIARAIVRAREAGDAVTTTAQLVDAIRSGMPAKAWHAPGGHPARRTFQALRIAVNDELTQLDHGLDAAFDVTAPGGTLAVISFHSLEDRIVKRRFAEWATSCTCPPELPECRCGGVARGSLLTTRPVRPDEDELAANPRASSARLRVFRRAAGVAA
jgi:16S rRNA (cytosine1402-N4)-methyltransferase